MKVPWLGQDRTIGTKGQYLLASSTLSSLDSRSATWKGWPWAAPGTLKEPCRPANHLASWR